MQKTAETAPCEGIECNDNSPCTIDQCQEGECVYTSLPDGISCFGGVCKAGACETIEEQGGQSPQTGQEAEETGSDETKTGETQDEGKTGGRKEETLKEPEKTLGQEETITPTGFFALEVTPSTIIVAIIAVICTFAASYFLFRKK